MKKKKIEPKNSKSPPINSSQKPVSFITISSKIIHAFHRSLVILLVILPKTSSHSKYFNQIHNKYMEITKLVINNNKIIIILIKIIMMTNKIE